MRIFFDAAYEPIF